VVREDDVVGTTGERQVGRVARRVPSRSAALLGTLLGLAVLAAIAVGGIAASLPDRWFGSHPLPTTIAVGSDPAGVAVDPVAHRAYVTNSAPGSSSVSVLDTRRNAVVATFPVGFGPVAVAVDLATHRAYVANRGDGTVSVLQGGAGS